MLSVDVSKDSSNSKNDDDDTKEKIKEALKDCMSVNNLSAETLLARFFDVSVLRTYSETRLGKSGKGNEATLAARIAKAWSDPKFEPLPLAAVEDSKEGGEKKGGKRKSSKGEEGEAGFKKKKAEGRVTKQNERQAKGPCVPRTQTIPIGARKAQYDAKEEEDEDDDDDVPRCFSCSKKMLSEVKSNHWEDTSICIKCEFLRKCPDCKWPSTCINYGDEHGFCGDCEYENDTCEWCGSCVYCIGDGNPGCCKSRSMHGRKGDLSDDSW